MTHRHTERFIAWYDMEADGPRWKVIDLKRDDPDTASGKQELAGVRSYGVAHSLAMDLESTSDER